jgi:hypothetical protein
MLRLELEPKFIVPWTTDDNSRQIDVSLDSTVDCQRRDDYVNINTYPVGCGQIDN